MTCECVYQRRSHTSINEVLNQTGHLTFDNEVLLSVSLGCEKNITFSRRYKRCAQIGLPKTTLRVYSHSTTGIFVAKGANRKINSATCTIQTGTLTLGYRETRSN